MCTLLYTWNIINQPYVNKNFLEKEPSHTTSLLSSIPFSGFPPSQDKSQSPYNALQGYTWSGLFLTPSTSYSPQTFSPLLTALSPGGLFSPSNLRPFALAVPSACLAFPPDVCFLTRLFCWELHPSIPNKLPPSLPIFFTTADYLKYYIGLP